MPNEGVHVLHKWGDTDRPMTAPEVLRASPILGTGELPPELVELGSTRYLYVTSTGAQAQPEPVVTDAGTHGDQQVWRVAVNRDGYHVGPRLGHNVTIGTPDSVASAIDPTVDFTGHRPEWSHQFFLPRSSPGPYLSPMRRLKGAPVTPLYIFGNDDRQVYADTSFPWRCVGKLYNSDGYMGSASLVAGNIIVTAGHMVPWTTISQGSWWMRFVPDYYDGNSLVGAGIESYVSDIHGYNSGVTGYDWAVGKLFTRLGDSLGFFGFNGWSDNWQSQNWWYCAGYPVDVASGERPSWQGSISIHDTDGDSNGGEELESNNADINHGDSGGPIFAWWNGDPRVIGVVSGEEQEYQFPFSSDYNNIFSSGSGFTNLIAWGRSNW